MEDYLGQTLEVGDVGVIIENGRSSAWFEVVEIIGFTPKMIKCGARGTNRTWRKEFKKLPHLFIKLRPEDVTMHLLRGQQS